MKTTPQHAPQPGLTAAAALSVLGWIVLLIGFLWALGVALQSTPATVVNGIELPAVNTFNMSLSVAWLTALSSALLHGLSAIITLLVRIDVSTQGDR